MKERRVTPKEAALTFIGATAYFSLLLFTFLPFLKHSVSMNSALYWFTTGLALFIPIFTYPILMVIREGNRGIGQILRALDILPFSRRDWIFSISGLLLVFICTGILFGVSTFLNKFYGIAPLTTTPWFMELQPFRGSERLLLFVWLPMFFFNIVGEELLWRGYLQKRLSVKHSWPLCSLLWMFFHSPFGLDLMAILIPCIVAIPYIFDKTKNTLTGIFIHGMFNGPIFVAVALGFIT